MKSIDFQEKENEPMEATTYYSQCECGAVVEGVGQLDTVDGTLYGENCAACGEEFTVQGWAEDGWEGN